MRLRDALLLNLFLAALLVLAQAAAPPQNASPAKPAAPPSPDPASTHFLGEAGLVLVAIKPAAVADYEAALQMLQDALAKTTDKAKAEAAKGWRVFKSSDGDAKSNQLYVHLMLPAVPGFDYRPSLLLDELITELTPDVLLKYQEAFAMPPSRLNLAEFAQMSVAPLPETPPDVPPAKKPGGDATKKPGGEPTKKPGGR
ncbi:MAG: hypothetical protein FJW22_07860 [Acidimicrobiia bacterium]|nr:hypothetical protein [Acidimicrobiia bacterium]